jgi:hypothetical protein
LFGHSAQNNFVLDGLLWKEGEKVSNGKNLNLSRMFDEEEVKYVVFQLEKMV